MQELENKDLPELCDILVEKTIKLLKAIENKESDGIQLHKLKWEVEQLQTHIQEKRAANNGSDHHR